MMSTSQNTEQQKMPPAWLVAVFGGVSGAVSALAFREALFVGLGTGGGVVLLILLYRGVKRGE
jgi:tellurite resistance protein TehA-like permease